MVALTHLVAVVTGASSGIGRAISLALAAKGATVCLLGRKWESLQMVAEQVRHLGACAYFYKVDLSVDEEIHRVVGQLNRDLSGVDILIHSAGVIRLAPLQTATIGQLNEHFSVNLRAPYILTRALLPGIKAQHGQIVFVNSTVGLSARANVGQYAASKHALKAIADSLREEVNGAGVRVLNLFLGRTASPMQAAVHESENKPYHPELLMQAEDVADVAINALMLPRTAEVTDISMRPLLKSY